jgi:hypothetical protein
MKKLAMKHIAMKDPRTITYWVVLDRVEPSTWPNEAKDPEATWVQSTPASLPFPDRTSPRSVEFSTEITEPIL